jgi:hypothetical protein
MVLCKRRCDGTVLVSRQQFVWVTGSRQVASGAYRDRSKATAVFIVAAWYRMVPHISRDALDQAFSAPLTKVTVAQSRLSRRTQP